MHLVCTYSEKSTDSDTYKDILLVGKALLQQNADPNVQNIKGWYVFYKNPIYIVFNLYLFFLLIYFLFHRVLYSTPLHLAIISGHIEMIDLLLNCTDVDTNLRTIDEKCALQLALMPPYTDGPPFELAQRLIQKGSRSNHMFSDGGDNLLQLLTRLQLEDAAVFLTDHSNLNHINRNGLTALHIACEKNLSKLVEALIVKSASTNIQSGIAELKTPLHFAIESNSRDVIEIMVSYKLKKQNDTDSVTIIEDIDFNLKNADGDSPLSLALSLGKNDLVPLLIKGGADVNARNGQDLTLLHQAILKEESDTAVFLLDQGADVNALTGEQETPLQLAIQSRLPTVVDALCNKGVPFSSPDNKGDPPLWTALELEQYEIASVLKNHGVDVDCWGPGPDNCLQTLLHRAIDENNEQAAVFLVKSNCDLDSPRQPGPNGQGNNVLLKLFVFVYN